ncbi:M13 family metallopeptidase [Microlunatus capsulatus]|uniref:Endopeptidase n=1 Tax=Microlunatus capsulatus TaxID=99117 RepID=A0ABS4Z6P3_9ACTN|nr:M13-type metalloendopeptidase [Microlunatus capsulatus]MBP2416659.1 putative endopeptidase [Microlunatus capsulatus]
MSETTPAPAFQFDDFDTSVRIQDDLFRHVNGGWAARTEIPDDKPLVGSFVDLRDRAEAAVRDIITSSDGGAPGSDEAKVADLFASFMDTESIEAAGADPLTGPLAEVDAVTTPEELVRLVGGFARRGVAGLVGVEAESDPGDPTRYVMFVEQSGLGLPDEEYYRADTYAEIRTAYQAHVAASLALAGIEDAEARAADVMALETDIAAAHWDKVKTRDLRLMYNLTPLETFLADAPGLHLRTFLEGAGIPEAATQEVVVAQPSFFPEVAALLTEDRLPAWRAWARWKLISSMSPYLSSAFVDERFRFYGTVLSGTPQIKERWKRGVALVEGALGEAVGRAYVERHFSPTAKERMDTLVANLIEAYRRSITELEWMTEATKEEALTKLAKFRPHIGYPTKWRDYSALEVRRDDLLGNVMRAHAFEVDRSVAKIGAPVDREEWLMTPQTVNAYYHPLKNEIVFPAAILQPPFFNETADDAVNYGGIGAVIGHEIGHGFDDQGSTCDGDGALRDWWTAADREAFETRTAALVEQYDALSPEGGAGQHVNGRLTIGENIGDLGGLSIAHLAHRIATEGTDAEPVDGYTPEQRLFLSWGAIWQSKARPETVQQRLATDPHSPNEFRCNQIVKNVDAFHTAFGVTEDDGLWMPEDQRVKIW